MDDTQAHQPQEAHEPDEAHETDRPCPAHAGSPGSGAPRHYLTTTIPYVNSRPHLGFALELVQADVLARHHRRLGHRVRLLTGTDENSLKNVLAAESLGVPVRELVDRNADAFAALHGPLSLSPDDFLRTSSDPRHRPGVERLWRACAANGDLYRKHYAGLYCVGCEQFWSEEELDGGRCPEHGTEPHPVVEENWFFRLSRYAERLHALVASGRLRVEPEARRNEVLAFIASGLQDFSVSRSRERARGWGVPVPDDPGQVVYVWWDALGNYITALDYAADGPAYRTWWEGGDRRVHHVGKGVVRFHAVHWPAILLSAGLPLPTDVLVHGYLTADGRKISKSAGGGAADPVELVGRYGTDAVRWWLLREVPRTGDVDFTEERLAARYDTDLADGVGNLVSRTVAMVHRYRGGAVPQAPLPDCAAVAACGEVAVQVSAALDAFDLRRATGAVLGVVEEANRYVESVRPWELARAERGGDRRAGGRLDESLAVLVHCCRTLGRELAPFLPDGAARIAARCAGSTLAPPAPLFPRLSGPGGGG
ncbi:methionine--tRNA ligase [Streptacidiphilus sp. ASG 303]|uniref:methionine--tRNA ligase n=1 Tax=Streptacidiphilus sp. ASG 303 TaxID=2896847 RepID=UPI001E608A55|nr:methionine--tRNA ligase [Streptacidiphilus sp. ASG 303]MCD0485445.1 methionine--tRNA ligase [Streptacidiphilus sp. ASG 303]